MKFTHVRKFIKARKELIKDFDELRGRVGGRDGGEADDVCVQNAGKCWHALNITPRGLF